MNGFASFLGLRAYLNDEAIETLDTWLDIAVIAKVDDEIIEIRHVRRIRSGPGAGDYEVHVRRGLWGTTPAEHDAGAELQPAEWGGVIPRNLPPANTPRGRLARRRRPEQSS